MYRRFLVTSLRRSVVLLVLICLGCSAQSVPSEVAQRIERQVRSFYSIPAGVKINLSPLKPSEFPNYDALTITFEGSDKKQTYDFLLSKDGKTLMRMKKIDLSGRPTRGNKDAKVVAVNYDDFECPYCSRMHQTLFPQLLKEYGDRVTFIYKDFPLAEIHPWAIHAAVDANCLASQNNDAYWDFADYIHANQTEVNSEKSRDGQFGTLDRLAMVQGQKHNVDGAKLQSCVKAQKDEAVRASVKEGSTLGVEATPTLFVNGEKIDGAMPIGDIRAVLDRALQQAGVVSPPHAAAAASSPPQPATK